jgi:myo-inositol-1-phosphate synthase
MLAQKPISIAIIGIGNCASSLVQGLEQYRAGANDMVGLMHWELGGTRRAGK